MGQDLLKTLRLNGEVDGQSHLFLSSGPPLAKAWAENLGAKVGGFGFGGALLGALAAKMDQKIRALTSLLLLRILYLFIADKNEYYTYFIIACCQHLVAVKVDYYY